MSSQCEQFSVTLRYFILINTKNNLQLLDSNEWNVFKSKGLHLIHQSINSILLKIDEVRYVATSNNAGVTGISESKFNFINK